MRVDSATKPSEAYKVICKEADNLKHFMGYDIKAQDNEMQSFDVVRCLEAMQYEEGCKIIVLPDSELKHDAETSPKHKTILLSESIYKNSCKGDLLSKYIIAHELGHLKLHQNYAAFDEKTQQDDPREHEAGFFASRLFSQQELKIIESRLAENQLEKAKIAEGELEKAQMAKDKLSEDHNAKISLECYGILSIKAQKREEGIPAYSI